MMGEETLDLALSGYNYVITAHKPTSVTQSVVGSFTGVSDVNLIIAKSSRLEIHKLGEEGLQGVVDVPVYGRISVLHLFRPKDYQKDLLFLFTERYKFCVLEYSASGELITLANGDLSDQIGRPSESGHIGIIDPSCTMIGLHLYDGHFKIIPMDNEGKFDQAFNIRLNELKVIDIKFLYCSQVPTIAVLFEDTKEQRHVKTYCVNITSQDLGQGPWMMSNLDRGSTLLIPSASSDGCIVVGENSIHYRSSMGATSITIAPTLMKTWAQVGSDGSRFLLSDYQGNLFLLVLEGGPTPSMKMEKLGETSIASSLCYLDSGIVFVGSSLGDSNLVKLHANKVSNTDSFVELIDTMSNIGPIVDFTVIDLDRQGQGQIVTCSGGGRNGSLRVVRNGIGFNEQANIELNGVKGVWSISRDLNDSFLVLSFIDETRVLGMNMEEELDEVELEALDIDSPTILCADLEGEMFTQVTHSEVRVISQDGSSLLASWKVSEHESILTAAATKNLIVAALSSKRVTVLQSEGNQLVNKAVLETEDEISCVSCSEDLVAVGLWDMSVMTYSTSDFKIIAKTPLGEDVMARSVLFTNFEGCNFLLCGLGDGSLVSYKIDNDTLHDRKKLVIGTKPITLRSFRYRGEEHVFAGSDRPTVIHNNSGKLLFSNLNESEVNHICSFDAKSFPDTLVLVKPDSLAVGTMDNIQKLHVRTVPLYEQPRRIAHIAESKAIMVTTTNSFMGYDSKDGDRIRLIDDQTFETIDTFQMMPDEMACCATSILLGEEDKEFFAVGTAFSSRTEAEPSNGRIRLFSVGDNRLTLVAYAETKGAVYSIARLGNSLIAGINSRIQVYDWNKIETTLDPVCGHSGHTIVLQIDVIGDLILVGDLMKSVQLYKYQKASNTIDLLARDFNPAWIASSVILDKDVFLGADSCYNLFTLKRNATAETDEDKCRLNVIGQYHLGDFVNRFRPGSLVMKLPDSEISKIPTTLFGTINGALGIVASLSAEQYQCLEELQNVLRHHIKGVGGLDHAEWRSFQTAFLREDTACTGYIDGDLLEQILDLSRQDQEEILGKLGGGEKAYRVMRLVEDLSRLH